MDYIIGSGFLSSHLRRHLTGSKLVEHQNIYSTEYAASRIFYLSAYGNLFTQTDEQETILANFRKPIYVLNEAIKNGCNSFVFVSTSSVNLPKQTLYSATKRAAEIVMTQLAEQNNFALAIIRPYTITGVGEQEEHLIPTLIRNCLHFNPDKIMSFVPNPTHDFIDVDDVTDAMLFISKNRYRGIFEVGTGVPTSNQKVKELVEKEIGKTIFTTKVESMRDYDSEDWYCKDDKLNRLGWKPKKNLKKSIKEMVEYEYERINV